MGVQTTPRIALWGTFDVANYGDLLFPRIVEAELRRRLPECEVQSFAPLGHLHPVPLDEGVRAEPLGPWSDERLAELAPRFDLVAIGGGELIHMPDDPYAEWYGISTVEALRLGPSEYFVEGLGPELERTCPVAWNAVGVPLDLDGVDAARVRAALAERAYVSVREEASKARLERAGVEREIAVVPDLGLLMERVLPRELLQERVAELRARRAYPAEGRPLVVQGSRALLPHVDGMRTALAAAADGAPVPLVLVETGPCHGDREFADALAAQSDGVHRLPPDAGASDVAAAIAHGRAFVGISLHGNLTAFVHGVPSVVVEHGRQSKLRALAELGMEVVDPPELAPAVRRALELEEAPVRPESLERRLDAHFDRLAELAQAAAERRRADPAAPRQGVGGAGEALRRAYEVRGRRLVEERLRLSGDAVRLAEALASAEAGRADAEARVAGAEARLAAAERRSQVHAAELERLRATRLFRYAESARGLHARLRGLRR